MASIFPNGMDSTPTSGGSKTLVCPSCKRSHCVTLGVVSVICGGCGLYFNEGESLPEDQATVSGKKLTRTPLDPSYMKMRGDIEKQADSFAKSTVEKERAGTKKSHERGGKSRDW